MTVLADLHTHSTASDGQYAPAALVEKAAAAGIQVLAVTDHDTIDGAEEAVQAGTAWGLPVLGAAWSWGRPRTGTCTYSACTSARSAPP